MDDLENNPAMQRRRLRQELQNARTSLSLTQAEVARRLNWSPSKLLRIENGKHRVTTRDLAALLAVYGIIDPQRVKDLKAAADTAQTGSSPQAGRGITPEYREFLTFERVASVVKHYESILVPGQLQTEAYAYAVIRGLSEPTDTEHAVRERVAIRQQSQQVQTRQPRPPQMHFLLDEAVIHRRVGGRQTMVEQLHWLKELNRQPNIAIQILPFDIGVHVGLCGPFILLGFDGEHNEPVLYRENALNDRIHRRDPEQIRQYGDRFAQLVARAAPLAWFDRIIDEAIAAMAPIGRFSTDTSGRPAEEQPARDD